MPLACMGTYVIGVSKVGAGTCGLPGTFTTTQGATPANASTHSVGPIGRST